MLKTQGISFHLTHGITVNCLTHQTRKHLRRKTLIFLAPPPPPPPHTHTELIPHLSKYVLIMSRQVIHLETPATGGMRIWVTSRVRTPPTRYQVRLIDEMQRLATRLNGLTRPSLLECYVKHRSTHGTHVNRSIHMQFKFSGKS